MKGYLFSIPLIMIFGSLLVLSDLPAADLKAPFDFPTAQVLPKGIRNFRYKGVQVLGNDKYDNQGQSKVLADPFFQEITWSDLTDPKGDEIDKGLLRGYLNSKDYDPNERAGRTTGTVSVAANAHIPVMAYGITDKITAAVAVPILNYSYKVDTGFVYYESLQGLANHLAGDGKGYELGELQRKLTDPIATKLNLFGYSPLKNEEGTKLGDINLVFKYQLLKNDYFTTTLQNTVVLPTGRQADMNKVIDVPAGDGQTDVGFAILNEVAFIPKTTIAMSAGALWQMKDSVDKRVPYLQKSKLSPDKETLNRDLGDIYFAQLGAKVVPVIGLGLSASYGLQYKEADRYAGKSYSSERYSWMEAETIQNMQSVQLGIGYSTLELFKQKRFPVPLEVNASYAFLVKGKNVTKDPLTAVEFVMFF